MADCNTCGHDQRLHHPHQGNCSVRECGCDKLILFCQSCKREVAEIKWHMLGSINSVPDTFHPRVKQEPRTRQHYIEVCSDCGQALTAEIELLYDRFFAGEMAPDAYLRSDESKKPPMSLRMSDEGDLISVRGGVPIRLDQLKQVGEYCGKPLYDFDLGLR